MNRRLITSKAAAPPLVGWLVGMIAVFHQTLLSGLRLTPGGEGDARQIHYFLEHGWRWLLRDPMHLSLPSPPILWPYPGTLAFSDLLVGFGPLYWPWRALGAGPHLGFVLFVLVSWSLNYLAGHLLLRRCFFLAPIPAAAGAFIFAFASPRSANMVHPQLIPQALIVVALAAVIRILEDTDRPWLWSVALGASLAVQFYSAWYPFFFFGLGLVLTAVAAHLVRKARHRLWESLRRAWIPLSVSAVLSAAAVAPGVVLDLEGLSEIGPRGYSYKRYMTTASLWLPGVGNLLYRGHYDGMLNHMEGSHHANGLGPITTAVALIGLWIGRRNPRVVWVSVGVLLLIAVSLSFNDGDSVWKWFIREWVPGATSIRAVARVGRFLLFPAAIGVGLAASWLVERRRWVPAVVLAGLCVAEQLHSPLNYDRVEVAARERTIAEAIPSSCEAFYLTVAATAPKRINQDAIWASLTGGISTLNSPFGNNPVDYPLGNAASRPASERLQRGEDLDQWIDSRDLDTTNICWIERNPRLDRIRILRSSTFREW